MLENSSYNIYRSDKAIELLTLEYKKLLKFVGKEIAVRNLATGKVHIGVLEDVSPDNIILKVNKRRISLKTENVEILDENEKIKLKFKFFRKKFRDYSILIDENFDEKFLIEILNKLFPEATFKVIDIYKSEKLPKGKKSVTIRVEFVDFNVKNLEEFFKKIGAKIR